MLGLSILDWLVVAVYFAGMIAIGTWAMRRVKGGEDYFMGGRRFGKVLSIFMAFGVGTSSDTAITSSREAFRNGMSGMWSWLLYLFITPFYWFTAVWYRRMRLLTLGDYFSERFESRALGGAYAIFSVVFFMTFVAMGLTATGKTIEIMTAKPAAEYTAAERQMVEEFAEFRQLRQARLSRALSPAEHARFDLLNEQDKQGLLRSYHSYVSSNWFIPLCNFGCGELPML